MMAAMLDCERRRHPLNFS